MSTNQSEEILKSYENDKNNILRQELESLKPGGKSNFISWAISSLFIVGSFIMSLIIQS